MQKSHVKWPKCSPGHCHLSVNAMNACNNNNYGPMNLETFANRGGIGVTFGCGKKLPLSGIGFAKDLREAEPVGCCLGEVCIFAEKAELWKMQFSFLITLISHHARHWRPRSVSMTAERYTVVLSSVIFNPRKSHCTQVPK